VESNWLASGLKIALCNLETSIHVYCNYEAAINALHFGSKTEHFFPSTATNDNSNKDNYLYTPCTRPTGITKIYIRILFVPDMLNVSCHHDMSQSQIKELATTKHRACTGD
jgi:hypothetical protein